MIEMGFSALAIADLVGHESVDITYKYAHLFPSKQQDMAQKLNMERKEGCKWNEYSTSKAAGGTRW